MKPSNPDQPNRAKYETLNPSSSKHCDMKPPNSVKPIKMRCRATNQIN